MKFAASLSAVLVFATSALAAATGTVSVSFDNTYDNGANSLNNVACSTGSNGLVPKGFTTFGSLPKFPFIGGADVVAGFDSPNCGTCWALTFNGQTINVLVVDHAANGFNIAEEAMNALTNGQAESLGRIQASAAQVDVSSCGL